jgi:hypothetical protein
MKGAEGDETSIATDARGGRWTHLDVPRAENWEWVEATATVAFAGAAVLVLLLEAAEVEDANNEEAEIDENADAAHLGPLSGGGGNVGGAAASAAAASTSSAEVLAKDRLTACIAVGHAATNKVAQQAQKNQSH